MRIVAGNLKKIETNRIQMQDYIDSSKSKSVRNRFGQFSTPPNLAEELLTYARSINTFPRIKFFDPAFGTGSFYSAFINVFKQSAEAIGFEIDHDYCAAAKEIWEPCPELLIKESDFTHEDPRVYGGINLLVCNPPYIRHQHLATKEKTRLQARAELTSGQKISGLAGMHAYFMLLSHSWLEDEGLGIWLVPSEILEVNYGESIRKYLLENVQLLRVHFFEQVDTKFDDALVSSCVIVYRKNKPGLLAEAEFTLGDSFANPSSRLRISNNELKRKSKWSKHLFLPVDNTKSSKKFGDIFSIKRGIATGDNSFFVLEKKDALALKIPRRYLKNILPSSRFLKEDTVKLDSDGFLNTEKKLVLLDIDLPIGVIRSQYPSLYRYLKMGMDQGVHKTYIASRRSPWYSQEKRRSPSYFVRYMNRESKGADSFHSIFIKNQADAIATNSYLMLYEKPLSLFDLSLSEKKIWSFLKKGLAKTMYSFGRTYGGGLVKFEPNELKQIPFSM